jgi:hypothetical protein
MQSTREYHGIYRSKAQRGAHHGAPKIPVAQRGALLVTVFEGEDDQNQVAADAMEVSLDSLPDGLVQSVQRRVAHPAASPTTRGEVAVGGRRSIGWQRGGGRHWWPLMLEQLQQAPR